MAWLILVLSGVLGAVWAVALDESQGAPDDVDHEALRQESFRRFLELFHDTRHVIRGLEELPPDGGHIIVMNHLSNQMDNSLPNRFTLTLDTHFVSAMLLYRQYGQAPVRVIRASGRRNRTINPADFAGEVTETLAARRNLIIACGRTPFTEPGSPVNPSQFTKNTQVTPRSPWVDEHAHPELHRLRTTGPSPQIEDVAAAPEVDADGGVERLVAALPPADQDR
jgi:hypothetical protein